MNGDGQHRDQAGQVGVVRSGEEVIGRAGVPGIEAGQLASYLPEVLDDYDRGAELTVRLLTGGRSNLTCLLAQHGRPRWVLRRPPLGHIMPTAHDMAREFRTLSALADSGFPIPRARVLCEDRSVLGVPFLIYDYIPGVVIADETTAGSLTGSEADHVCGELMRTLVHLHRIPPPPVKPGQSASSVSFLARQVTRWTQQWQRTMTRELPGLHRLASWLTEEIPKLSADYPVTFVHGDYRLDNLVTDPYSKDIRAVLDWEMSTVGDPLTDVALLLVYWEEPDDRLRRQVNVARSLTTSHGFWSRDRLLREYRRATSLPLDHLDVCLALACLKLAVIAESIHYRYLSGKTLNPLSADLDDAASALIQMGLLAAAGHGLAALAA